MSAALVGLHDLEPFAQVGGEAAARGAVDALACLIAEHDEGTAGRAAPALLWRADQHVDAAALHVDPDRARGDAVEDEEAADLMHRIGDPPQVSVRKDDARSGFHMRREHQVGALFTDRGHHLVDVGRCERRLRSVALAARLQHHGGCRDCTHLEDLGPAIAEPAVAQHHAPAAGAELTGNGLHAEAAATRDDDRRARAIGSLEQLGHAAHHRLEPARHVVERAIGIDDRVLEQTLGVGWYG